MKNYDGLTSSDYPLNGGAFVDENGYGHEILNFQKNGQFVYGYVQARNATINIDRIGANGSDFIDRVLVYWRARSILGSVVVGWYRNARVFRNEQEGNKKRTFVYDGKTQRLGYIVRAKATDAFLVPVQHRTFRVPVTHKGFGSQTFVSFLDQDLPEVEDFRQKLLAYSTEAEEGRYHIANRGRRQAVDAETKARIEATAIEAAVEFYLDRGYDVTSVEAENTGYDLVAVRRSEELHIEVKGTSAGSQEDIAVTLTPNEYSSSKTKRRKYRIVIVYAALDSPQLLEFYWNSDEAAWFSEQSLSFLRITESTSATLSIDNG